MKLSRRAKRMQQHHGRQKRTPGLNLVSLMDIFTILVFFLLVSSTEVQDVPSTKAIKLPESVSQEKPRETLTIVVTTDDIIVQGEPVAKTLNAMASDSNVIEPLKKRMIEIARNAITTSFDSAEDAAEREVMIMGDRDVPYRLLKKIIVTCTEAKYNHISLAVVKKTTQDLDG
jgi:biopolymer transport protein ExbD